MPVMIVSACMFILGYATTWAPGVWILIGETFPTKTRAKQGALSTASNWYVLSTSYFDCSLTSGRLWNFLIAFFTPFIVSAIQFKYGFVFACKSISSFIKSTSRPIKFPACNLAGAVIVYFFLYESSDLSLESVDNVCISRYHASMP